MSVLQLAVMICQVSGSTSSVEDVQSKQISCVIEYTKCSLAAKTDQMLLDCMRKNILEDGSKK